MRRLLLLAAFVVCCSHLNEAQDLRPAEVFAGYSYFAFDSRAARDHLHGFEAAATGYVNDHFGVTGGISGHFDSREAGTCTPPAGGVCFPAPGREVSLYNFLGGVQLKARGRRLSPFARASAGGSWLKVSVGAIQPVCDPGAGAVCPPAPAFTVKESSFSFAAGGGLDLKVKGGVSLRLIQAEYLPSTIIFAKVPNCEIE
jgi:opacity protein-like surface antigen